MATETRRPLAWEILNVMKRNVRAGVASEVVRLDREAVEHQAQRQERTWWLSR